MKSIAIPVLLLLASVAHADEIPIPGTPPAGWVESKEHAALVRQGIDDAIPGPADIRVYSYSAPTRGAGQMIFSVVGTPAGDEQAAADYVRARVDELHGTAQVMANEGGKVRELGWQEATDPEGRVVDAMLEWAHEDNATHNVVRAAWLKVTGQPDIVLEIRAECVLAAEAVDALRPACADALASMLLPEASKRLPLIPTVTKTTAEPPPSMTATPPGTAAPARPLVEPSKKNDWRPFYVIGALIVLASVFLWNRKRREEYDAEDQKKAADKDDDKGDDKDDDDDDDDEDDKREAVDE